MLNALVSAVLQVGVVLLVSVIVYALFSRNKNGLFRYLGLVPTSRKAVGAAVVWGVATAAVLLAVPGVRDMAGGDNSVVGETARGGLTASIAVTLAIKALLQTALSEELLFRGLIGKRLIAGFGFAIGNAVQAILFGAMHLLLLLIPQSSLPLVIVMVVFTGASGWVNGWLNERLGRGSIAPGSIAHGLTNLTAYLGTVWFA